MMNYDYNAELVHAIRRDIDIDINMQLQADEYLRAQAGRELTNTVNHHLDERKGVMLIRWGRNLLHHVHHAKALHHSRHRMHPIAH